ncbi:hypothetical protein HZF05_17685 [Sphingomonas sp. CGMCC 1.13654]|uniref:Uncharacterized protein n=1 Tax=Sphingomonas chungangi TaxID=2683589 RepID=A0A838LB34_9SPHN|nr:hypothetical protein [Sphingomonas chungangi]MBA2935915.1 hypothetical protein [Sphingomonas chungangi]MVW54606.1 hypothetical protein [Sphingomonas chungangi]
MELPKGLPLIGARRARWIHAAYWVLLGIVLLYGTLCEAVELLNNFRDQPASAHYAFLMSTNEEAQPIVGTAWPEAAAVGAIEGSRIEAIDGVRISGALQLGSLLARRSGPITLQLATPDGHQTSIRLSRLADISARPIPGIGLTTFGRSLFQLRHLVIALFFLSTSILLKQRRPRDPEAMLLAFGFLLLCYNQVSNTDLSVDAGMSSGLAIWIDESIDVIGFWAMLVGICAFPDGRFATRWARLAWMVPTIYVLANMASRFALWQSELSAAALDIPIFTVISIALLFRYRATPSGMQRQQIKWALLGGAVMVMSAAVHTVVAEPAIASRLAPDAAYMIGRLAENVLTVAFPVGLIVSVLRYRLYDADTVISRSAGYAVLTASLVAVFACTEQLTSSLGQDVLGNRLGDLAGGLGAAVAAVMIAPLHSRIGAWAERRFRKALLHLRHDLPLLVADLRETATVAELGDAILKRCERALHAQSGALLIGEHLIDHYGIEGNAAHDWLNGWVAPVDHHLAMHRDDPLFPLHLPLAADGVGLVGWLFLGPRPDGSLYGRDERTALAEIADPIARALAISGRRIAYQASVAARFDRLEKWAAADPRFGREFGSA